jgi:hypothetical protein
MAMSKQRQAMLEQMANVLEPRKKELFAFLQDKYHFVDFPSSYRNSLRGSQTVYRIGTLGIEVDLNYDSCLVSVWLAYIGDETCFRWWGEVTNVVGGVRIRSRLEQVLGEQLQINDKAIEEIQRIRRDTNSDERNQASMNRMLKLYQQILRHHIATILQQPSDTVFPPGAIDQSVRQRTVQHSLEEHTRTRFAFLPENYGFSQSIESIDRLGSSFEFRGDNIGVEIRFDYFDPDVNVILHKLLFGMPEERVRRIDDRGKALSVSLSQAIKTLNSNDPLIHEIRRLWENSDLSERGQDFCLATVDKYGQVLQNHIEELLRLPVDVIFPL